MRQSVVINFYVSVRKVQQKKPSRDLHSTSKRELVTNIRGYLCVLSLEHFPADLVKLALRTEFADREDECVRGMFSALMYNQKIAQGLLDETRSPQDAFEYVIREKI